MRPLVVDVPSLLPPPPPPPPPPSPPSRKAKAKAKDKGRDKSKDKDKDKDKDKGKIKSKVKVKHRSDQSTSGPVAPVPLETYLKKSLEPSTRLSQPAQLLVILDLNGTLLCRTKGKSAAGSLAPTLRPGLREFLAYLLSNFKAMIWTSARPENAARMVNAAFKEDEKEKLLAIWGRDTLGLTQAQYNAKVQVYKVLGRAWEGEFMVYHPDQPDSIVFDQTNTVLFDDSIEKAVGHPYNLIHIPEFLATKAQNESDVVLCQCIDYLEEVKWQSNVSAFIRQYPFVYTPTETIGEIDNKETEMGTSSHDEKEMDNDDIRN